MAEIIERQDLASPDRLESDPAKREREAARKRVEKKHKFRGDVVAYVVINLFLIGLWAATGFGYFWPALGAGRLGRPLAARRVERLLPPAHHRGRDREGAARRSRLITLRSALHGLGRTGRTARTKRRTRDQGLPALALVTSLATGTVASAVARQRVMPGPPSR